MLEQIADKNLLITIADRLKKDNFKPGFDGMSSKSATLWITLNYEALFNSITRGRYKPSPAISFRSLKKDGKFRTLARLTAVDTTVQRAALAVFGTECEKKFSDYSHAYIKERSVSTALRQFCEYAACNRFVAKLDPVDCFGSIDYSVLENALHDFTGNKTLIKLLMSFAKMPVIEDGQLQEREKGVLQGAPISALLCNIYLHRMDAFLENEKLPFVRYADDIVIFGNSFEALKEAHGNALSFMNKELMLRPNENKCVISPITDMTYLGQRFTSDKNGAITIKSSDKTAADYFAWNTSHLQCDRKTVNVLSEGILRQKDYSVEFETDSDNKILPVIETDAINIFSEVVFDVGFLKTAFKNGVSVNVFDKTGELIGSFTPEAAIKNPKLTLTQLRIYDNPDERLYYAKQFVLAALHNIRLVIRYYNKQEKTDIYTDALNKITSEEAIIKRAKSHEKLLLSEVRMREAYYNCFDSIVGESDFIFDIRSKRPPENELNAMLSFGNTLLYNYIATEISKTALDVRIGCLHATNKRNKSLNLDIAEIFKPLIVDRIIFTLINKKSVKILPHFERLSGGGVYLSDDGKRIFIDAFYNKLETTLNFNGTDLSYSDIIKNEIRKLIHSLRTGEKYKAFRQVR